MSTLKYHRFLLGLLVIILIGCSNAQKSSSELKIGLLLEETIDDHGWNSMGYQGLLNIHTNMGNEVVFKEGVKTSNDIERAVNEFVNDDVKLIFGHGRSFAEDFTKLGVEYPNIDFVSFNGEVAGENVTSLHFNGYAMGYFAGMIASAMSLTHEVGVIAAFPWQPEVEGFLDGAKVGSLSNEVHIRFVDDWSDEEEALSFFKQLQSEDVDVFYPAGDGFHLVVIEEAKKENLYAIGYIGDQSDLGESTVLTSTIQRVDKLYELVAKQYMNHELKPGNISYDFQDDVIYLGKFSPDVPIKMQERIEEAVKTYIETGKLPTESLN